MKMCDWSERVALLVDEEDAATRAHVASCGACAELLAEMESDRELMRSMPVPEMRVRRRSYVWQALAAALFIGALVWMYTIKQSPAVVVQRGADSQPAAVAPTAQPEAPVKVATKRSRRPPQARRLPPTNLASALEAALPSPVNPSVTAKGEVVIAMQTEDPNVIIVLVKGDSDE